MKNWGSDARKQGQDEVQFMMATVTHFKVSTNLPYLYS
jgi:hypothetical protein